MAIVTESYRQWLLFETRTDDITCMVIQITGLENCPNKPGAGAYTRPLLSST